MENKQNSIEVFAAIHALQKGVDEETIENEFVINGYSARDAHEAIRLAHQQMD